MRAIVKVFAAIVIASVIIFGAWKYHENTVADAFLHGYCMGSGGTFAWDSSCAR